MKMSDVFPSQYLKASDFPRPRVVTIREVRVEILGDESKAVVYFQEGKKGLVLNVTNANSIQHIAGSDETDDWRNVKIELYPIEVQFQSKMVPGIRVRAPKGFSQPARTTVVNPTPASDEGIPGGFDSEPGLSDDVPF